AAHLGGWHSHEAELDGTAGGTNLTVRRLELPGSSPPFNNAGSGAVCRSPSVTAEAERTADTPGDRRAGRRHDRFSHVPADHHELVGRFGRARNYCELVSICSIVHQRAAAFWR